MCLCYMSMPMLLKFIAAVGLVILAILLWANWPSSSLPTGTKADRIVVEKGARILTLYRQGVPLKQYRVSLGHAPTGAKEREGDKKTPEGVYRIIEHKSDSSYHLALRVSYPEPKDVARARTLGLNPGSDIMIHGLPNGYGVIGRIQRSSDWTAGCIALTNPEIEELFATVDDGVEIEIRP